MTVAHYSDSAGAVIVNAGIDVGGQDIPPGDGVEIVRLPVVLAAVITHRGPMSGIPDAYADLEQWMAEQALTQVGGSRELYREWHAEDPHRHLTEIQIPVE